MKSTRFRNRMLVSIVGAALLVTSLSACGADSSEKGVINVALQSDNLTESFNPFLTTSALGQTSSSSGSGGFIYEPLVQVNNVNVGQDLPWLASSWDWSDSNKRLELHLHKGVRWTDGAPFTARDVAFTYNLLRKYPALNTQGVDFQSAKARDDSTVELTFASPSAQAFTQIVSVPIVSEHQWSKVEDPVKYSDPHPVGTGPFAVKTYAPQSLLLVRNNHYWKGEPALSGIRFIPYKDAQSETNAFVEGQADWGGTYIANAKTAFVSKSPNNHYWAPIAGQDGLIPNLTVWPLSDVAVRKAISLGVDRKQIAAASEDQPALNESGLPLPTFNADLADDLKDAKYKQDKAEAAKTLNDAGYSRGADGYYQKNGKRLEFSITFPSAYTEIVSRIQVLTSQLKDIGIKLDLDATTVNQINLVTGSGRFQSTMGYPVSPAPTAFSMYQAMMDPAFYTPIGTDNPTLQNIERFNDPEAAKLFKEYPSADPVRQKVILDKIEHIWADQLPMISLIYWANYSEWRTSRFTGFPTSEDPYFAPFPNEVVALRLRPVG